MIAVFALFYLMMSVTTASLERPNIVFLVVESTDGRAWDRDYQDGAVSLPNIKALQDGGVEFTRHYSNTPVCCPSRATFWSGRHAHNIPHNQKSSGIFVGGSWNNHEGLPLNFSLRLDQVLEREGYDVKMAGKLDYTTGAHTESAYLNAWTMYTRFPYNVSARPGGWAQETGCVDIGQIQRGNKSVYEYDWETLKSTTAWIRGRSSSMPFFVYQGMDIVHPPYRTNEFWFHKVDQSKIRVPPWKALEDMHPCDFQTSMLKGCIPPPSSREGSYFYKEAHRRKIRAIYLAMIAEFDAMVGDYVQAVKDAGAFQNTIFIVTSDHGDMQMEQQQFYKMAPYEASARVPMVIMDGRSPRSTRLLSNSMTQLIDIYPTVLTYAGVPKKRWPQLDGTPIQPLISDTPFATIERPDFVVSQFHGEVIAMSWFLVVHQNLKLIVWGTGEQHPHQLFNLTADPDENNNVVHDKEMQEWVHLLLGKLTSVIDYPAVANNVAKYQLESMQYWIKNTPNWQQEMGSSKLRWHESWSQDPAGAVQAVENWLSSPPKVSACRSELVWPPALQRAVYENAASDSSEGGIMHFV